MFCLTIAALICACGGSSPFAADEGAKSEGGQLILTPETVQLDPGQKMQFEVSLLGKNNESMPAGSVKWTATGGKITSGGLYTAGSVAGTFHVTARRGGLADRSVVAINGSSSGDDTSNSDGDRNSDGGSSSPPPSSSPSGVRVEPGQSIQAAVDRYPAGTTFVIAAGRHMKQSVVPKDGNVFAGESGAVLDGGGTVPQAFSGKASGVKIQSLVIEHYAPAPSDGVIHAKDAVGWVVERSEIRYNVASVQHHGCTSSLGCGGMGIKMGERMVVRDNYLHHNDQYGVGGAGSDILVEGNEIAFNNYRDRVRTGFGAGGTKFVRTLRLVVRNNYVHDNHGNGLWTDIGNMDALIEGNRVENNHRQGIFHEVSHAAVIRNNTVRGNGFKAGGGWLYGAGILVAHSDNVEVYGNVVEGNLNGIVGIQQNRGTYLKNLWVHDNRVQMNQGASGVEDGANSTYDPFSASANNRFDRNDYRVSSGVTAPFRWGGQKTWKEWQAVGQDPSGSFSN